jgi:hypothetical protein
MARLAASSCGDTTPGTGRGAVKSAALRGAERARMAACAAATQYRGERRRTRTEIKKRKIVFFLGCATATQQLNRA